MYHIICVSIFNFNHHVKTGTPFSIHLFFRIVIFYYFILSEAIVFSYIIFAEMQMLGMMAYIYQRNKKPSKISMHNRITTKLMYNFNIIYL